jgi:hypothetical protein
LQEVILYLATLQPLAVAAAGHIYLILFSQLWAGLAVVIVTAIHQLWHLVDLQELLDRAIEVVAD